MYKPYSNTMHEKLHDLVFRGDVVAAIQEVSAESDEEEEVLLKASGAMLGTKGKMDDLVRRGDAMVALNRFAMGKSDKEADALLRAHNAMLGVRKASDQYTGGEPWGEEGNAYENFEWLHELKPGEISETEAHLCHSVKTGGSKFGRVLHLAKRGKKSRTRKKNAKRISWDTYLVIFEFNPRKKEANKNRFNKKYSDFKLP